MERSPASKAPTVTKELIAANGQRMVVGTKYTEKVHKKILDEVRKGTNLSDAGFIAGLGKDTIHDWLSKGRHNPDQYPQYHQLSEDIAKIQAEKRSELVETIVQTGLSRAPGTWQAAAWYLERTDPNNWGRKDRIEHSGDTGPKTQVNTVVLIDSEAREAARDLLRRVAGRAGADESIGSGGSLQLEAGDS